MQFRLIMSSALRKFTEDIHAQERLWFIQKHGRALIALIVISALLGLFGEGILSRAHITEKVKTLWIEPETVENKNIKKILPEPNSQTKTLARVNEEIVRRS